MCYSVKSEKFKDLQTDILRLQGFNSISANSADVGLGFMFDSFPNGTFPIGAVHEFLAKEKEDTAATNGFIAGILLSLMKSSGTTIWISSNRILFPPALKSFGVEPHQFIFIDLKKESDVLWAMDEALKCDAISAVVGEMSELDFTSSRRLQLAVEKSNATGFVIRKNYKKVNTTACVSRWKVTPSASESSNLPGVGFPKWKVELLRMRNGKSGTWNLEWREKRFVPEFTQTSPLFVQQKIAV